MQKLIVAHRGASKLAAENTMAAFSKAIEVGADMIELDVRRTKDGQLVVIHNPDFQNRPVRDLTFAELRALSQNQIPLLWDVLQLCRGKIKLDVELKEGGYENIVGDMLAKNFDLAELLVTSFSHQSLLALRRSYPQIKIALLVGFGLGDFWKILRLVCSAEFAGQFDGFIIHHRLWFLKIAKLFPSAGKFFMPFTVDSPRDIKYFLNLGEFSAICTNRPDLAVKIRQAS